MTTDGPFLAFPDGFTWGAATASYQVEGAAEADGRGPSIWDTFSRTPGKVVNGDTGDVACDHYHRYREDVALMASLNLKAYRFSTAWPRILPAGDGPVNPAGLDFYSRLVDELLAQDIEPYITLYHWDLPQALQDRGGWGSRTMVEAFTNYADVVTGHLGDRVKNWVTHNEPMVFTFVGYGMGRHAPGLTDFPLAIQTTHHVLLAHGQAVPIIRQNVAGAKVGIVLNMSHVMPDSDSPEDVAAAQRQDGMLNRWFADPVFKGSYPADILEMMGENAPEIQPGDLEAIRAPLDFLGVNYYARQVVKHGGDPPVFIETVVRDEEVTAMGWGVYPDGLYELLKRVRDDYAPPALYITENGAVYDDAVGPDGTVDDPQRLSYIRRHLAACHRAIAEDVPLRGYFVWSLLDNFEWAYGYTKRFGITYVDYETLARTLKASGQWYGTVVAANGLAV